LGRRIRLISFASFPRHFRLFQAFRIVTSMPVVLLKSATKQILHVAKRSIGGSVGRSSSFSEKNERSRHSFGYDRSRQSSFERMNQSGPITYGPRELSSLNETERLGECSIVNEMSREYEDFEETSPSCKREPIKKPKKDIDGDVSRMHFQDMFGLRSFGASKSPVPDRDDTSSSRIAGFFRRKRESNDSLTGSTASEDHTREHRVPFFFRKRSDVTNSSGEDEDDWPRSLGLFGGSSSNKNKSVKGTGDEKEKHPKESGVRKCLSALKRHASGSSQGSMSSN